MFGLAKKLFGSANERFVRQYHERVQKINALEPQFETLSDEELAGKTAEFRARLAQGATLDSLLTEAFATVREASKRVLGMRHFDVQMIGGMVLHEGRIAEMKTGEGKTLVATLPAYLNALPGGGMHLVTVNDYLAKRDSEWMGRLYGFLGMTTGTIVHEKEDAERKAAYLCDITYGTNNEYGFDYLRDNMKYSREQMVQRPFVFALVDEVDSILIDEARTPLIISGPTEDNSALYVQIDKLMPLLTAKADIIAVDPAAKREPGKPAGPQHRYYDLDEKSRSVALTEEGVEHTESLLKERGLLPEDASLYDIGSINVLHHVNQALKAHTVFTRDVDYMVKDDKVVIIDEFTGRMMEGRRYSDGLHQALEAKEGAIIQNENQTLASITFQNYFRLFPKLAGMTGTAMTEANEFADIYGLEVVEIPTNVDVLRLDLDDEIYRTAEERYLAVVQLIAECYRKQQPVLVGTVSIEKSEHLSALLKDKKVFRAMGQREIARADAMTARKPSENKPSEALVIEAERIRDMGTYLLSLANQNPPIVHQVLNARHHDKEAQIVAQAGRPAAVTIATNMAGRGTDIKLGGNAEMLLEERLAELAKGVVVKGKAGKGPHPDPLPEGEGAVKPPLSGRGSGEGYLPQIDDSTHARLLAEITAQVERDKRIVMEAGGLYVIGTERHESRRIDNQLRGRSGRQGDPGGSKFFLSLQDDLMRIFGSERIDGMLVKLGMKEGEAIIHPWMNKAIERAQTKVEARNYDIRKNLLKYDDVMNDQRKVIYEQRIELMEDEDVSETIEDIRADVTKALVLAHIPPKTYADLWDPEGLEKELFRVFGLHLPVKEWAAEEGIAEEEILERVEKETAAHFGAKDADYGAEIMKTAKKRLLLQTLDQLWKDHLLSLDHLRSGINLRAYAQKDPLNEYKSEAFGLFERMLHSLREVVTERLSHMQVRMEAPIERLSDLPAMPKHMHEGRIDPASQPHGLMRPESGARVIPVISSGMVKPEDRHPAIPESWGRVGRNEPCPCGSGQKFKYCHGKLS